jgi:hypothetical protein
MYLTVRIPKMLIATWINCVHRHAAFETGSQLSQAIQAVSGPQNVSSSRRLILPLIGQYPHECLAQQLAYSNKQNELS